LKLAVILFGNLGLSLQISLDQRALALFRLQSDLRLEGSLVPDGRFLPLLDHDSGSLDDRGKNH